MRSCQVVLARTIREAIVARLWSIALLRRNDDKGRRLDPPSKVDAKKGTVRDYAPMAAIPVGVPCFDGQGSTGVVISAKR